MVARPIPQGQPHRMLALNDGDLYYTDTGSGTAILLIHGSLCDLRYWRWQITALSERHRIIVPSLRGCWPQVPLHPYPGYSIQAHAQDLARLAHALDIPGGLHVVGHSRGAQVALAFATHAPQYCRTLTLADPGFRFEDERELTPFYASAVQQLQSGETESAIQSFIDTVNGANTWEKMVAWFKDMVRDNATTLLSQILEANTPVHLNDISRLTCPLLLMGGALSPAKYKTRQDRLQQILPQASRIRIPLAAHGMNLANPRAFNQGLLDFMQDSR